MTRELTRTIAVAALQRCGITHDRLVRLRGGIVNDVYRAGRVAVARVGLETDGDDFERAAAVLRQLPRQVKAPHLLLIDTNTWARPLLVCSYTPGRPMDRAWTGWGKATRIAALEQVIAQFEAVHTMRECAGPFVAWRAARVAKIEGMLDSLAASDVDRELATRLASEWRRVGDALPGDDICVIHGDFNGGNAMFQGGTLSGLIDFDDVSIAPRSLDYRCMGMVLNEPPFLLAPRAIRKLLAPVYRFDGQARAWQAEQLYWTLRGLVDPFVWDESDDRLGDARGDIAAYFDSAAFLRSWFD